MAKIKSTLDLVMERTKGLSMSSEEKEALHKKEWTEKARGWVGMLVDHKSSINELKNTFITESRNYSPLSDIIRSELLSHLDPDMDSSIIMEALAEVLGLDVNPFEECIKEYRSQYDENRVIHKDRLASELRAKEFSGPALVPNLEHDEIWTTFVKTLKEQFKQKVHGV